MIELSGMHIGNFRGGGGREFGPHFVQGRGIFQGLYASLALTLTFSSINFVSCTVFVILCEFEFQNSQPSTFFMVRWVRRQWTKTGICPGRGSGVWRRGFPLHRWWE